MAAAGGGSSGRAVQPVKGGEGALPCAGLGWPDHFFLPTDCSRTGLTRTPFPLPGSSLNMPHSFGATGGLALTDSLPPSAPTSSEPPGPPPLSTPPPGASELCWPTRPTLRNELDTFSVHFYIFFGPNVSVPPDRPAVFAIQLLPVLDSGGVLNLELRLNVVSPVGLTGLGGAPGAVGHRAGWGALPSRASAQGAQQQDLSCCWRGHSSLCPPPWKAAASPGRLSVRLAEAGWWLPASSPSSWTWGWGQAAPPEGAPSRPLTPAPLLPQSSLRGENATVFVCLNHEVPLAPGGSAPVTCETGEARLAGLRGGRLSASCPAAGGQWCPEPCSAAASLGRAAGRLPPDPQRDGPAQQAADPLPTDRDLVPESPLTLCRGPWVKKPLRRRRSLEVPPSLGCGCPLPRKECAEVGGHGAAPLSLCAGRVGRWREREREPGGKEDPHRLPPESLGSRSQQFAPSPAFHLRQGPACCSARDAPDAQGRGGVGGQK